MVEFLYKICILLFPLAKSEILLDLSVQARCHCFLQVQKSSTSFFIFSMKNKDMFEYIHTEGESFQSFLTMKHIQPAAFRECRGYEKCEVLLSEDSLNWRVRNGVGSSLQLYTFGGRGGGDHNFVCL